MIRDVQGGSAENTRNLWIRKFDKIPLSAEPGYFNQISSRLLIKAYIVKVN